MFDLPVGSREERKAATSFRNFLLDEGFHMAQFSVYMRVCPSKEKVEAYQRRIEMSVPNHGLVQIVKITDKQYETITTLYGHGVRNSPKNPDQLALF